MNAIKVSPKLVRGAVCITRSDGLKVFLDGDLELDRIRLNSTKREVIIAVAKRRAQQIAMNYAGMYAPELLKEKRVISIKELEV